jgi:hypothetical protein
MTTICRSNFNGAVADMKALMSCIALDAAPPFYKGKVTKMVRDYGAKSFGRDNFDPLYRGFETAVLGTLRDMQISGMSGATVTLKLDILANVDIVNVEPQFAYKITTAITHKTTVDGSIPKDGHLEWTSAGDCYIYIRDNRMQQVEMFGEPESTVTITKEDAAAIKAMAEDMDAEAK